MTGAFAETVMVGRLQLLCIIPDSEFLIHVFFSTMEVGLH